MNLRLFILSFSIVVFFSCSVEENSDSKSSSKENESIEVESSKMALIDSCIEELNVDALVNQETTYVEQDAKTKEVKPVPNKSSNSSTVAKGVSTGSNYLDRIRSAFNPIDVPVQKFVISSKLERSIETYNKNKFTFKPDSFVYPDGSSVETPISLEIKEYMKPGDFFRHMLTTQTIGGRILSTNGTFNLVAKDNKGKELVLAENASYKFQLAKKDVKEVDKNMRVYKGVPNVSSGQIDWEISDESPEEDIDTSYVHYVIPFNVKSSFDYDSITHHEVANFSDKEFHVSDSFKEFSKKTKRVDGFDRNDALLSLTVTYDEFAKIKGVSVMEGAFKGSTKSFKRLDKYDERIAGLMKTLPKILPMEMKDDIYGDYRLSMNLYLGSITSDSKIKDIDSIYTLFKSYGDTDNLNLVALKEFTADLSNKLDEDMDPYYMDFEINTDNWCNIDRVLAALGSDAGSATERISVAYSGGDTYGMVYFKDVDVSYAMTPQRNELTTQSLPRGHKAIVILATAKGSEYIVAKQEIVTGESLGDFSFETKSKKEFSEILNSI